MMNIVQLGLSSNLHVQVVDHDPGAHSESERGKKAGAGHSHALDEKLHLNIDSTVRVRRGLH